MARACLAVDGLGWEDVTSSKAAIMISEFGRSLMFGPEPQWEERKEGAWGGGGMRGGTERVRAWSAEKGSCWDT